MMGGRPTPSPLFPSGIGDGERREIPNIINKTTNSFFNPSAATAEQILKQCNTAETVHRTMKRQWRS